MTADGAQPVLGPFPYGSVGHDQEVVVDRDAVGAVRHKRAREWCCGNLSEPTGTASRTSR